MALMVATIKNAIDAGWAALGNVPLSATYYQQSADPTYSTTTGAVSRSESTVTVTAIVEDYREDELAHPSITIQDRRIMVRASQLGITPHEHDRIVVGGVSYEVVRVTTDPAKAVWVLQARGRA